MPKHSFTSEQHLCETFLRLMPKGHFTAYPETEGWDILLVRVKDGFQIGIQAKLRLNEKVFSQAIESYWSPARPGPDCRAVMVPGACTSGLEVFAPYAGITIIRVRPDHFDPYLPLGNHDDHEWFEVCPAKRCPLPEYVPVDVAPGRKSPIQLTPWKIGALKLEAILETNGCITRMDFRSCGIDHRRWINPYLGWLQPRDGVFVKGPRFPNFAAHHPVVFEQVKADLAKAPPGQQQRLL